MLSMIANPVTALPVVYPRSGLSRSDLVLWPEAAVHRDAAIRPQLGHKLTWHGHRECPLQPRQASPISGDGRGTPVSLAMLAAMRRASSAVGSLVDYALIKASLS